MPSTYAGKVIPPVDFVLVSAGAPSSDVTLPNNCRGLLVGATGTINVTMANGERRDNLPIFQGQNPGRFAIVHGGGNAENIWAIV